MPVNAPSDDIMNELITGNQIMNRSDIDVSTPEFLGSSSSELEKMGNWLNEILAELICFPFFLKSDEKLDRI